MHLEQFFAQREKKFWEDGIMKLPERWQKVKKQNGEYVIHKVIGENEKCAFYFCFKTEQTFWPSSLFLI